MSYKYMQKHRICTGGALQRDGTVEENENAY